MRATEYGFKLKLKKNEYDWVRKQTNGLELIFEALNLKGLI